MTSDNIDKAAIAELRKKIASAKGIARRADDTADLLRSKASRARGDVRRWQAEIENLGGRVIR